MNHEIERGAASSDRLPGNTGPRKREPEKPNDQGVGVLSLGRVVFLLRNPLAGLPILVAFAIALGNDVHGLSLWLSGCAVVFAGVVLRAWSGCFNTYGRGTARRLATSGPYAVTRNPLYLGSTLIIAGACLSADSRILFLIALPWSVAVYHVVVLREENRLREKHAQGYADYFASVPRWIPNRLPTLRPFVPIRHFVRTLLAESGALLLLLPSLYLVLSS